MDAFQDLYAIDPTTGVILHTFTWKRVIGAGLVTVNRLYLQGGIDWIVPDKTLFQPLVEALQGQEFLPIEHDIGLYLYLKQLTSGLSGFPEHPKRCPICEMKMLERLHQAGCLLNSQVRDDWKDVATAVHGLDEGDMIDQLFALWNLLDQAVGQRCETYDSDAVKH